MIGALRVIYRTVFLFLIVLGLLWAINLFQPPVTTRVVSSQEQATRIVP